MTIKTIDQLQDADALTGDQYIAVRTANATGKATVDAIAAYIANSGALQGVLSPLQDFITSTQDVLTSLAASVGQNTTTINSINSTLASNNTRLATVESLVLTNSASAPANSVAPTLTGTATVGQTLTVVPGTWSGTIVSRTYTFRRGNVIIQADSATTTYLIQAADGAGTITVTETVHSAFPDASKTSIGYVVGAAPTVPVANQVPFINGTAAVGQTGTFTRGTYTNSPTSYTQQWYRSGSTAIAGATGTSYVYGANDAGLSVTVREIAINGTGPSIESVSPAVVVSGAIAPTYTGGTPPGYAYQATYQVGVQLMGDVGAPLNNPDPTLYTYQHYRSDVAISGATSLNYTPVSADGNKVLQIGVIPRNAAGAGVEERSAGVFISGAGLNVGSTTMTQYNFHVSWASAEGGCYNGESGSTTNGARARLLAAVANLQASSLTVKFPVVLFIAGNNDQFDTACGARFQQDQTDLITRMRSDWPMATTKFVQARVQTFGTSSSVIRAAQAAIAAADSTNVKMVDTDAYGRNSADNLHWRQAGLNSLGASAYGYGDWTGTSTSSNAMLAWVGGDSQANGTADDQSSGGYTASSRVKIWTGSGWVNYNPGVSGASGLIYGGNFATGIGPELGLANAFLTANATGTLYLVKEGNGGSYMTRGLAGSTFVGSISSNVLTVSSGSTSVNTLLVGSGVPTGVYVSSAIGGANYNVSYAGS